MREIRNLVRSQKPDMVCIQETKLMGMDSKLCSLLWEGYDFDWVAQNVVGRSGGLIIMRKKRCFVLNSEFCGDNFLSLEDFWGVDQVNVNIVNVYAPCDLRGKKMLWDEIESEGV